MAVARVAAVILVALVLATPAGAVTIVQRDAAEPALVQRINAVRASHGLKPLSVASRLRNAATRHSNSMAKKGYFRHELLVDGVWKPFGTWIRWYWPGPGYTSWSAGENLAWGAPDLAAQQTVTLWMNSPGHRANLLNKSWTRVGVSIVHATNATGTYASQSQVTIVTADFGRRSG